MNKLIEAHSMKVARFLAESEEKTISRFMKIVGLEDEYQRSINLSDTSEFNRYAQIALIRELADRGYEIGEYHDKCAPIDGVEVSMKWRLFLLHDGEEVAYNDTEIKIGTMRRTEYGGRL